MKNSSDYRVMARESLSDRWAGAVCATLLIGAVYMPLSVASSLLSNDYVMAFYGLNISPAMGVLYALLFLILLIGVVQPLLFAYTYSFRRMRQSELSIWACMKVPYGKALLAPILYAIFFGIAIVLSVLVIALISFLLKSVVVMGLLCIPVFVYAAYLYYSFAFYPMFVVDNPDMALHDCFVLCYRAMNGRRMELFLLDLSFIGWYLLNILTLGLATVAILPYHFAARAAFYEDLIATTQTENTNEHMAHADSYREAL